MWNSKEKKQITVHAMFLWFRFFLSRWEFWGKPAATKGVCLKWRPAFSYSVVINENIQLDVHFEQEVVTDPKSHDFISSMTFSDLWTLKSYSFYISDFFAQSKRLQPWGKSHAWISEVKIMTSSKWNKILTSYAKIKNYLSKN